MTSPDTEKIRVLIADDHPLVREGIKSNFSHHAQIQVIGEAADGDITLQRAKELNPDVVLMDISMPKRNGIDAARILYKSNPEIKILFLTMYDDPEYVSQIQETGAKGYVLKDAGPTELEDAIRTVRKGEFYFSPQVSRILFDAIENRKQRNKKISLLTNREKEILAWVVKGESNKEVAKRLSISVRTVETHRAHIMKKLNIHNVAGLITFALENKIVEL